MLKNYLFVLLTLILVACDDQNQPAKSTVDSSEVSSELDTMLAISSPAWYKTVPRKEGYIYASAMEKSKNASIANSKALMQAQIKMARLLKKMDRNSVLQNDRIPPGPDKDPVNENLSIGLSNIVVRDKKQIKYGGQWHVFVLAEMKLKEK